MSTTADTTANASGASTAHYSVTLSESTPTTPGQTHLGQAFTLSSLDRYLSFTIASTQLQSNSAGSTPTGPEDAFEVALLNANTGASLLGHIAGLGGLDGLGSAHSDAALNLQLGNSGNTLQERAASQLVRTLNPDGSRTYTLDLSRLVNSGAGTGATGTTTGTGTTPAGLAVNLSFDLIGFGTTPATQGSSVRITDVRLIRAPLAADDHVSLAEDGHITLDATANDANAHIPGYTPELLAQASHGQVQLITDPASGQISYSYSPAPNYYGPDSFTYRIAGGSTDEPSNTATVFITVTPVNDAPTPGNQTGLQDQLRHLRKYRHGQHNPTHLPHRPFHPLR